MRTAFGILGPLEVRRGGVPVRIGSRMQRRLLALLLVHAGESVSAERAVDVLWAGEPPPSAPTGLRAYVSRLRRFLGDGAEVVADAHGYRLGVDDGELDAWRFEELVAAARARITDEPEAAAATFDEALTLWRGPAFAEFADEEFARPEAVRLEELRLAATEDAFDARLAVGDVTVVADLEAFVATHPLRERPHAVLMTALARAGRQIEALEVFQGLRRRLVDELGLEPSPALRQVERDILQQAPPTAFDDAGGQVGGLHEEGEQHAREQGAGTDDEPDRELVGNLPRPLTSFVGRHHEIDAVCRLLERRRLVTLTGVGGVGKTRLALEAAAAVATRHPDGVWWCELAPADSDAVGHAVASVLGVRQQAHRSVGESVIDALVGKRLLLILDNCEHVVSAVAPLAGQVVRDCHDVTILASSREPLGVEGEQVWRVPPLPLPGPKIEGDDTSAQLFYDRAAASSGELPRDDATSSSVADICRQLDGVPLAIELAAALVPALEPAKIAERLGDRFGLLTHGPRTDPRHRTLVSVVEWSYQLLDEDEQQLFDRLAVFSHGFTLEAAEGVCADGELPTARVAGLLAGLVSRSMVGVDRSGEPARYHLLETLRQYAGERLAERGEVSALRARHAAWFVELAEHADTDIRGPREADGVGVLEAELANLRAAHRWAVEHDDADLALRLAAVLYIFAFYRLHDEVFVWAEEAAKLPPAAGHRLEPTVWGAAALGATHRGELARARELAERALEAAPDPADEVLLPAWHALALAAMHEGRLAESRHHYQQALSGARRAGDAYACVVARVHPVFAMIYGEERQAALDGVRAARTAADELGSPGQQGWSRYLHAEALGDDDPEQALRLLEEAVDLAEPVHDRLLLGVARVAIATLGARHQSPRASLASFSDVIRHWRRAGDWTHQWPTLRNLIVALVRLDADEAAALLVGAERGADTAAPVFGADAERLAHAREDLVSRLGRARFEALAEQGEQLSGAETLDLALEAIDEVRDTKRVAPNRT